MPTYSFNVQDVNGDPFTSGANINIVNGSISYLSFEDVDGVFGTPYAGETVSVNGGPPQTYEFLGTGFVRGNPMEDAAFIRLADGTTFAIDLNVDGDNVANLTNGNTKLTVANLDTGTTPEFPVPPDPVCFTPGTLIATPRGQRPVDALRVGDLVTTLDAGPQPIRWIGRRAVRFRPGPHRHKPVMIAAGALGGGLPRRDLVVSPQHRMLIGGVSVRRLFDVDEVLALSKGLLGLAGVRAMHGRRSVDYISVLLDQHQVLFAEGSPTESFLPGPNALKMIGARFRGEILDLFPALRDDPEGGYGPPARRVLTRKEAEALVRDMRRDTGGDWRRLSDAVGQIVGGRSGTAQATGT